ncbi:MAG TPA: ROK family protein [Mesorhizobium sp.]|jgi:glucokinase|nr:ROK family protein [Mesorhizobium sp.]
MNLVGLDIGGTHVRVALVDEAGQVRAQAYGPTHAQRGASTSISLMIQMVRDLLSGASVPRLQGLGIGITGPVDAATGVVSNPYTLAGWPPTDIRTPFAEAFGVPVTVDNDANVAAIGEWWMGAGKGSRRLAMVTIGTGIGVATLVDGRVQRAADGRHGEAGHMVLNPAGPPCYCGANGCWEVLASGTALGREAKSRLWNEAGVLRRLAGGVPDRVDSRLLFEAAAEGDEPARALIDECADWIGLGLVNLGSTFMPDRFVMAGGLARHLETLRHRIEAVLQRHSVMVPYDRPLAAASLGEGAGPVGAARLALDAAMASHTDV